MNRMPAFSNAASIPITVENIAGYWAVTFFNTLDRGRLENHTSLEGSDDKDQNDTLNSEIARRFLQLDCKGFERLRRYETALWRQVYQVIFVLDVLRRQNLDRSWLPRLSSSTRLRAFGSLLLPKS
jgi:hypothetical protein